jgi:hypothetical protein
MRIAGYALMTCVILLAAETGSWITLCLLEGGVVTYGELGQEKSAIAAAYVTNSGTGAVNVNPADREVLHPYFGAGLKVGKRENKRLYGEEQLADYGFEGDAGPFVRERSDDRFVINITGGSVARGFLDWGGDDVLREELKKIPAFKDKEIVFSSTAFYGHKEPQQLLAIQYVMSLGATFDMIVSLDGFNEITMGKIYNMDHGASPFYPYGWFGRLWQSNADPALTLLRARGDLLQKQRAELASAFDRSFAGRFMAGSLLWTVLDRRADAAVEWTKRDVTLYEPSEDMRDVIDAGPLPRYENANDYLDDAVSLWERSTEQLALVSRANGIRYLSVLQPNQYAGKHVMTRGEKAVAWNEESPFRPYVEHGYPLLREAGKRLQEKGIAFADASDVFDTVTGTVYTDNCCHFNAPEPNAILAKRIAKEIAELLKTSR